MITTLNGHTGHLIPAPRVRATAAFLTVDHWIGRRLVTVRGQRMTALLILAVDRQGAPAPSVTIFSL